MWKDKAGNLSQAQKGHLFISCLKYLAFPYSHDQEMIVSLGLYLNCRALVMNKKYFSPFLSVILTNKQLSPSILM